MRDVEKSLVRGRLFLSMCMLESPNNITFGETVDKWERRVVKSFKKCVCVWLRGVVDCSNDGGSADNLQGRFSNDYPLLTMNYCKTSSATRTMGLTDVNKSQRSGIIKLWKIVGLLPCFSETEKVNLMVSQEILEEMSFAQCCTDQSWQQCCPGWGWC